MAINDRERTGTPNRERRILFAGSNASLGNVFEAAESANPWAVSRAGTAEKAWELLHAEAFAAVVAESQLPDLAGAAFLDKVMVHQPHVIRILRFPLSDSSDDLQGVGQTHHLLREPCDAMMLRGLLEKIEASQPWMPNPALPGLLGRMRQVPSPPSLYFQVVDAMTSGKASLDQVGELIARDPTATAKLLHLANSAAFALRCEVTHPAEALNYLGFEATKTLLLIVHSHAFFESVPAVRAYLEPFWEHAQRVGRMAREVARIETNDLEVGNQAFTAGLLHDFGKLLFAANLPQEYGSVLEQAQPQSCPLWEIEEETFGASHGELGAYLLGIWNLPKPIVEAVAWHHYPRQIARRSAAFSSLTAVHVANVFEHEQRPGPAEYLPPAVDLQYLEGLGGAERLAEWRQSCPAPAVEA